MKKENGFTKFLESNQVNAMVSILIIISLALLVVHKIIDFSVKTDKIFDSMDEVFLIFFSIEFLIKILYLRKKYFIHDLGWIDLLAALPVLTPLIKYLLLRFNVETFLVQETASITIVLRGFRFIRFLRILRTARLLRFFNYAKISNKLNERKSTFTIPVIFSMILLLLGYFLISSIETQLRTQKIYKMNNIMESLTEDNLNLFLKINPDILIIQKGSELERTISDREIKKKYQSFEHSRVKGADSFILFSLKDILDITKKIEVAVVMIVFLFILSIFSQFILDIRRIKKRKE